MNCKMKFLINNFVLFNIRPKINSLLRLITYSRRLIFNIHYRYKYIMLEKMFY